MSESGTELGANDGKFGGAAFAEGASISSRSVQERGARRGLSRIEPWAVAVLILLSLPIAFYGLAFPFAPEANPDFYVRLMSMPWYAHLHFLGSAVAYIGRLMAAWPARMSAP